MATKISVENMTSEQKIICAALPNLLWRGVFERALAMDERSTFDTAYSLGVIHSLEAAGVESCDMAAAYLRGYLGL